MENLEQFREETQTWLEKNGYKRPLLVQYSEWLGSWELKSTEV